MSAIRGKDTTPELLIRRGLHAAGYRYRLHGRDLPGKPDIVLPRYGALIFVHGCFWHGHDCHMFRWPSSRAGFWKQKIEGNIARDNYCRNILFSAGWRIMTVWECAAKGSKKLPQELVIAKLSTWLRSSCLTGEIIGEEK